MFGSSIALMVVGLLVCACTIGIAESMKKPIYGIGSILIGLGAGLMGLYIFG